MLYSYREIVKNLLEIKLNFSDYNSYICMVLRVSTLVLFIAVMAIITYLKC